MLLQHATQAGAHPLSGTIAEWAWLLPVLPLIGFIINGLLSLAPAYHAGPADPDPHGDGGHAAGHEGAVQHAEHAGAHGDDHHPVARHRFAGMSSLVGPLVLAASFGLAVAIFFAMLGASDLHAPFIQRYFSWMPAGELQIDFAFQIDQLSMVMVLVITGVGTLIHIFSIGYMR